MAPNHRSPHLSKLHGDIVLELLGSFGPGLLIPALQAAGKLLQDAHVARCHGSCGGGRGSGSKHLALRFCGEKLPLIFWITNYGDKLIYGPVPQHRSPPCPRQAGRPRGGLCRKPLFIQQWLMFRRGSIVRGSNCGARLPEFESNPKLYTLRKYLNCLFPQLPLGNNST